MNKTNDKKVQTIDGTVAFKSKCRYIKNNYYTIGDSKVLDSGQCYKIGDKYYRASTGYITYNYSINRYVVKKSTDLVTGVVGIDDDHQLIFGDFEIDKYSNVALYDEENIRYLAINSNVFKNTRAYRENISNGNYLHICNTKAASLISQSPIKSSMKRQYPYNASDEVMQSYIKINNNFNPTITPRAVKIASYLKGLSFGVEFETTSGILPERLINSSGLIPLRDGSITGLEYVTIPLNGPKGLECLSNSCKGLSKYTSNDKSCSLHLHIGGIPRTEKFIIALFRVLSCVQDDIYSLFPLYKRDNLEVKRQNYTKEIPFSKILGQMDSEITDENMLYNFNKIYTYLSGGYSLNDNGFKNLDSVTHHPSDPRGTSKWYIKSRYSWVNMIPLIFGNKKTIEFRIHTGTTDVSKTLNYLFICSAIINFVKDNERYILQKSFKYNTTIKYIIDSMYTGDTRKELFDYIYHRHLFQKQELRKGIIDADETKFKYTNYTIKLGESFLEKKVNVNIINPFNNNNPKWYNNAINAYEEQVRRLNVNLRGGVGVNEGFRPRFHGIDPHIIQEDQPQAVEDDNVENEG